MLAHDPDYLHAPAAAKTLQHLHVTPQLVAVGCAACRHAMLRVGAVGFTPRIAGRLAIYVERRPRTTNAIRTVVGVGSC